MPSILPFSSTPRLVLLPPPVGYVTFWSWFAPWLLHIILIASAVGASCLVVLRWMVGWLVPCLRGRNGGVDIVVLLAAKTQLTAAMPRITQEATTISISCPSPPIQFQQYSSTKSFSVVDESSWPHLLSAPSSRSIFGQTLWFATIIITGGGGGVGGRKNGGCCV